MAEKREQATEAFDLFIRTYEDKYPAAVECSLKDQDEMLVFYDFPAAHWQSIRTTNQIESMFATIRHRTKRSKGCLSRHTMLHMMFKFGQCAEKKWRRLRGFNALAKVTTGVKFKDFIEMKHDDQKDAWFNLLDTAFDNSSGSIAFCASLVGTGQTVTIN